MLSIEIALCAWSFALASGEHVATAGFLQASDQMEHAREIENRMHFALHSVLDVHNSTFNGDADLKKINASLLPTFTALPKLPRGKLAVQAMEYLIRSYFAKEHGWVIRGLGVHGSAGLNTSQVQHASVLQDAAPAVVESLLEARDSGHSFALDDVIKVIATIEHLVISGSSKLLDQAYGAYSLDVESNIDEATMLNVLVGHSILFENTEHVDNLPEAVSETMQGNTNFHVFSISPTDAFQNDRYAHSHTTNPFKQQEYSYDNAWNIVTQVHREYGMRQHEECMSLKSELMKRDAKGTGRVPLHLFYQDVQNSIFFFGESFEYLRDIGALDESNPSQPNVLIANYVQGPSNCLSNHDYHSVCCVSECETLMNFFESHVQAPSATAEQLLALAGNLSSSTVEAPRILPDVLQHKMRDVADHHGGMVPLHGRLFAQWLHFSFPNECPYPALQASSSREELFQQDRSIPSASKEDKWLLEEQSHQMASRPVTDGDDEIYLPMWSNTEILHVAVHKEGWTQSAFAMLGRLMQGAALVSGLISLVGLVIRMRQEVPANAYFDGKANQLFM